MDNEKDLLLFIDEDEAEYTMEVIEYFEYDGEEFAILTEAEDHFDDEDQEIDVYIMQVVLDDESKEENFIPVEGEKLDEIVDALNETYDEDETFHVPKN